VRGRLRCQAYLGDLRVRVLRGPDAAEASPRRRASWRSRGRWWRGPAARATERPCRLSAVPAGPRTAVCPGVVWTSLVSEPRPPATSASPVTASAGGGALRCSLGRPRRLGLQEVVHTGWGKGRAQAGERLLPVGLRPLACRGSSGPCAAQGCTRWRLGG